MAARAETLEKIASLTREGYKYGFFTDIESEQAPLGLNEGTVRFISAKKKEPQWLLEWRLQAFRHWQKMEQPDWAKLLSRPSTIRPRPTTRRRCRRPHRSHWTRSIPSCCALTRSSASCCGNSSAFRGSQSTPCLTAFPSRRHSRRSSLSSASFSVRSARPCASIPSWCASTSARSCRRMTTSSPP